MKRAILRTSAVALALILGAAASTRADFIITFGPATLASGSATTIDVFIQSTTSDPLNNFQLQFGISGSGQVRFGTQTPADFAAIEDTQGASPYVFADESAGHLAGAPGSTPFPGGTFNESDYLTDFTDNATIGTSPLLLTRLVLISATGTLAPTAGSTFAITLSSDPNLTFFDDADFNSIPFTSPVGGTVIITPAVSAVPEPSSLFLVVTALSLLASLRRAKAAA